jgi:hypothetical protein
VKKTVSILAAMAFSLCAHADEIENSANLRMNQIQVVATHNSYHLLPSEPLFSQVKAVYPDAATWNYAHRPLDEQLDNGVRGFELDLNNYPDGIRVFHVPAFDTNSTCDTFVDCLTVLRDWSKEHPAHVPVIVLLELKNDPVPQAKPPVVPFDATAMMQLEEELLSVFEPGHLLRPDDVRGETSTLRDAIQTQGWPKLDDVRGRVMFVLHTSGEPARLYAEDHPSLEDRAMFLQAYGDEDFAAVYVKNDPTNPNIPKLVEAGYLVRTRADANLKEALEPDTARRDLALASGAHLVTTDFPSGEAHPETGYVVAIEGGKAARVNSVARD